MRGWPGAASEFDSRRRGRSAWPWPIGFSALALGLQTLLPMLQPELGLLNLPLVATINLMLWCRSAAAALLWGALIGCAYDGLTHGPVGVHGIVYTICGGLVAWAGPHLRHHHALLLGAFFGTAYLIHELLLGLVRTFLMGVSEGADVAPGLVLATVHAGMGLLAFTMLGKAASKR